MGIIYESGGVCSFCFLCFVRQKTAYEMRISDWISDVCSSDLSGAGRSDQAGRQGDSAIQVPYREKREWRLPARRQGAAFGTTCPSGWQVFGNCFPPGWRNACPAGRCSAERSEEHTSELQSLMRISYAVFCLKKKKK